MVHTHTHTGLSAFGKSFAAGEQAVRQEMKCLIRNECEPGGPELGQVLY